MDWNFRDISSNYCPRQFEYHPSKNGERNDTYVDFDML